MTRIERIATRRKDVHVFNLDAEAFILEHVNAIKGSALVYCDPPYFNKADRLYTNFYRPDDHERIAKLIQGRLKKPWLVSYDNVPQIATYYAERRTFTYRLQYTASSAYEGSEVFFFSDELSLPARSEVKNIDAALLAA